MNYQRQPAQDPFKSNKEFEVKVTRVSDWQVKTLEGMTSNLLRLSTTSGEVFKVRDDEVSRTVKAGDIVLIDATIGRGQVFYTVVEVTSAPKKA